MVICSFPSNSNGLFSQAARAQFYLTIDDPGLMRECPTDLLKMMSHIG